MNMNMNVIHITVSIDRGGSENHLVSLVENQIKNGYFVTVVFFKGNGYWKKHLENLGVVVFQVPLLYSVFSLNRILLSKSPDILHAHLQTCEIISWFTLLLYRKKIKFIISKHNDENSRFLPSFLQKPIYKLIASKSTKIIAISENVKSYCINILGINKDKIIVIYYGIDSIIYKKTNISSDEIKKLSVEFGLLEGEKVVGTIARLHPQKSLDTLIEALEIVNDKSENIKLIIVGEGPLEQNLKFICKQLNIENKVIFTGKRNDIPNVLQLFDVFVLCSIYEGLGLVILEAMSAGVPVIGTIAGAIPEIIGNCGILVEPKNKYQLSDAIIELLNNNEKAEEFRKLAFYKIKNTFTLSQMFLATESTYN